MQLFFRTMKSVFLLAAFLFGSLMTWHVLAFIRNLNPLNPGADVMLAGIAGMAAVVAMVGFYIAEGHCE